MDALDATLLDAVMLKMSLLYGKRFLGSYVHANEQIRAHFGTELAGLSEASVRYMLEHLPGDSVPNVRQLRALANQRPVVIELAQLAWSPRKVHSHEKREALAALRILQQEFIDGARRSDGIAWALRIHSNTEGKSRRARELAEEVLRAHGHLS
ncbi:hypothetical protein GCM10028796_46980 [Ramlibacter monticola]|uniref:Uncharacterized protein n=1 Tax=Ramlibacter monticola TaxID=1926872 RepID=A0A937CX92_9BURK|nr:hypothetical protein [Ramlibacter monticola]MBL0394322.1 hypothetical protein [Ramlibacter monticola]